MVLLGLGQGVGLACARKFAEAKWSVMIVDGDQKTLDRAEKDLGELSCYLHEDQYTPLGLKNALSGTLEQYDGVDVVINVPPLPEDAELQDLTVERLNALYKKGAMSFLLAAKTFSAEMIREIIWAEEQVERVVHPKSFLSILSRAAIATDHGKLFTSAAQGAVLAAVKALALELSPNGIRSNALISVRPRTEKTEPWLPQRTPLGRSARPPEIAETAYFLSSAHAGYITGQGIEMDGGRGVLNGVLPNA